MWESTSKMLRSVQPTGGMWGVRVSAWSNQVSADRPYLVPGNSPSVKRGGKVFQSKITIGGINDPAAFTLATTVI